MAQKSVHNKHELLSLREMFSVVGDQLTARDVRVLRFMFSGIFTSEFLSQIHDGVSFLQALEKVDRIDESNFKNLENYLRLINRYDLYQFLTLRKRTPGMYYIGERHFLEDSFKIINRPCDEKWISDQTQNWPILETFMHFIITFRY